jgi:hypothetical protein
MRATAPEGFSTAGFLVAQPYYLHVAEICVTR